MGSDWPRTRQRRKRVERKAGSFTWKNVRVKLLGLSIRVIDADGELAELAGEIKAFHKMSPAGCFAAAFAKQKKWRFILAVPSSKKLNQK